jgi:hypothetical protein
MGTMAIPDHTGHRSVAWHPDDATSIADAEQLFRSLTEQRLIPFARLRVPDRGADFEQIRSFDPEADEIMWVRPLQGG